MVTYPGEKQDGNVKIFTQPLRHVCWLTTATSKVVLWYFRDGDTPDPRLEYDGLTPEAASFQSNFLGTDSTSCYTLVKEKLYSVET